MNQQWNSVHLKLNSSQLKICIHFIYPHLDWRIQRYYPYYMLFQERGLKIPGPLSVSIRLCFIFFNAKWSLIYCNCLNISSFFGVFIEKFYKVCTQNIYLRDHDCKSFSKCSLGYLRNHEIMLYNVFIWYGIV